MYARDGVSYRPTVSTSAPPEISSNTVFEPSSASRLWSTYASFTVGPSTTSPESGCSLPVSILNSVDLPAPFGPMMPTIAPAGILKFRLSISRRSPNDLLTFLNSITSLPRRSPTGMKISCVSLRFWYSWLFSSSKRAIRAFDFA
ncbi:Uncharacterised protein [Burkholderia pseudomallei]|nr:Uncharacterised protein [Burkholderia pseudomallei]CAJ6910660.1 Uncharacterised protein [Burkholderia pseudomallei]